MNRGDLIDAIAKDTEESKAAVARVLDAFTQQVQRAVAEGRHVKLPGFGKFDRAKVSSRRGRNPVTGEPMDIPARARPRFTPAPVFKDLVQPE